MFISLFNHYKKGVIFLLVIMLVSCVTTKPKTTDIEKRDIEINEAYGVDVDVTDKFNHAVELINENKYDEAIKLLIEVTSRTNKHSAPYVNLGIAYLKTGKIVEAEESLLKAFKINPDHPVTNNELGMVYRKSGRFAEAKNSYERVIKKYPEFLPARKNLGILCDLFMDDLGCAIEHYEAYLNIKQDEKNVQIWLTDLKRRAGKQ